MEYGEEPVLTNAGAIANIFAAHNNALFKFKQNVTGKTAAGGTKMFEIMVSLKYLSNFWRTFEMLLTNWEINLILTWSEKCVLSNDTNINDTTCT